MGKSIELKNGKEIILTTLDMIIESRFTCWCLFGIQWFQVKGKRHHGVIDPYGGEIFLTILDTIIGTVYSFNLGC